ncbi:sperm acrosome-associated protein 9 isoform X2 [Eublepharis macularius]|nr:sperm acrosome-associated protein 9 isoform X2 [Eublepharis macularius]
MDHHCNNTTDKRILLMFLNLCSDLSKLCQRLETLHSGNSTTNALLEKCKMLVSHSNDLSAIRAKYPHDVVNHLSCDEARNHYGGVVSLIPIILDCMKEWVAHSEKLPRNMIQSVSGKRGSQERRAAEEACRQGAAGTGLTVSGQPTSLSVATQTSLSLTDTPQESRRVQKKLQVGQGRTIGKLLDGPWKPPGKHSF